jgi:hypothetical protein
MPASNFPRGQVPIRCIPTPNIAVTQLNSSGVRGIGIAFSLGEGNLLVCAALEEPDALAFSVTRERFKLAASNGIPLDGGVCAVQSGLILPGAARNLHWMGAHADIHDCGCDRLWHFLGLMK